MGRMSAFDGLWKFEFMYSLSQDNHGENVSIRWLVKIQIHVLPKPGQPRRECQRSVACEDSNSRTNWAKTTTARMSAFGGLWKFEFTYSLSQDNHGKNVSVRWLVKIRIHVLAKPGQPRGECQHSVACENSNSHTLSARTTTATMSAFVGLWNFEFTYSLSQENHGENVSVRWLVKNRIHVRSKPGQPQRECQRSVACEKSDSRTL